MAVSLFPLMMHKNQPKWKYYFSCHFIAVSAWLIMKSNYKSIPVSYTHLRAHETCADLVCRLLLEKKTIILVEQNAKKGLEFADIGYVLVSGQTAIAGKGDELLQNPDVGRLFLGG